MTKKTMPRWEIDAIDREPFGMMVMDLNVGGEA